jgi:hypothetical protein
VENALLVGLAFLFGSIAFAQDPKAEVSLNYSYMRFNPENNSVINSFSLNGGGGALSYFFNSMIGIKAKFEGYESQTRNFNFTNTTFCNGEGTRTGAVQGNLFSFRPVRT